jgi:hypothetical protein
MLGLSDALWAALEDICRREDVRLLDLLAGIQRSFEGRTLGDAAEIFVAAYFRRIVHAAEGDLSALRR